MGSSTGNDVTALVVGAGAIGSFYGAILQRQGVAVSVVCRSDYEVVVADGFRIKSPLGDLDYRPQVVRHASEVAQAPDYLLLCVKVLDDVDRVALIRDAVGPDTTIVLIENGVEIEGEIAEAFPGNTIISALAFIAVSRSAPGVVEHHAYGHLVMGGYPRGVPETTERLVALFEAGGVNCTLTDDVVTARWEKCVWNGPFNPASVAGGGLDTGAMLGHDEGEAMIRRAMAEVCAIAAACGHPQREGLIDDHIAGTRKMPPYKTSMALDFENGREMEVEAILGNTVRAARREQVPAPTLEALYGLLKMIQTAARQAGR